jgi:SAM-dependent methyltransferase
MGKNNPYHRAAGFYDINVALPVISAIRRQEAAVVGDLIARCSGDRVLEVGPGTGYYTLELARRFKEVVAVEDAAPMAAILTQKLAAAGASNVEVINRDFRALAYDKVFDVGVAIGVLDYIDDPAAFVARLCAASRRAVVITAPQRGFLGHCFVGGSRLRKTKVYCYAPAAPPTWAPPSWRCQVIPTGLHTSLTKGLTLAALLEAP